MEFCEKSTLRDCIDGGLCHDPRRVWQLFREIVEGLVHIHEQVNQFNCVINQRVSLSAHKKQHNWEWNTTFEVQNLETDLKLTT